MKIKRFESYDYSEIDLYDYFLDIEDECFDFKIETSIGRSAYIYDVYVRMSIFVENCKNPLLVDFSNIIMKKSNIIKRFANSMVNRKIADHNANHRLSDYSIDENSPDQILNGFKKTKLIKWIEDSSDYILSGAGVFRVENGVGMVMASGYTAKLYFKKMK